jgi:FAD/FMN-containing dehydrogenase
MDAMRTWSTGTRYLNFAPEDGRPQDAFSPEDWARLQRIKAEVDPRDLFRTTDPEARS